MAAPLRNLLRTAKIDTCIQNRWRFSALLKRAYHSTVLSVLNDKQDPDATITVNGWVRSIQKHKDHVFLHINDGSSPQPLQIVAAPELIARTGEVTYASCITVQGHIIKSLGRGQAVELIADTIRAHGKCDAEKFPFGARHRHSADYCRDYLHLRPKTESFASLLRLRSSSAAVIHSYFQEQGYLNVHTPVITSNDCEGGGEVFAVQPVTSGQRSGADSKSHSDEKEEQFFAHPVFLTVSGQLHLEAVASAISKVYSFGPTFRAENSRGRHHLSEFYMVEAEVAFLETLENLLNFIEDLVKTTCQRILQNNERDIDLYLRRSENEKHKEQLCHAVNAQFLRVSYTDAVELLEKHNEKFKFKVKWGEDLKKEHEKFLTVQFGNIPVFVTDFPASLKPFYVKANRDGKTVAAVDLLVPGVGELVGGSLREDDLDVLTGIFEKNGMLHQFEWYLDLRRFGSSPHGGFGLGFERFLQFLLGTPNIKDVIPFPRWSRNCQL